MAPRSAVCDSGPIIHLSEIGEERCLGIFEKIYITDDIAGELEKQGPERAWWTKGKRFAAVRLDEREKRVSEYLAVRFGISMADASVISVAKSRKVQLVLTDDLDLRIAAKQSDLVPVGSVGIVLRAYREGSIDETDALSSLDKLLSVSSLYITPSLVRKAKEAVQKFKK